MSHVAKGHAVISIAVPTEVREALHKIAREEGRTLSGHLRWLAQQDIKRREQSVQA